MALWIRVNGETRVVDPKNGADSFSLDELKRFIGGGYIEVVALGRGMWLVCDEDGKRKNANHEVGFGLNSVAQKLVGDQLGAGDYLVGSVLLCSHNELK